MTIRVTQLCYALIYTVLVVGCSNDQDATSSNDASASTDARLVGQWNLESKQTLENGHDVTSRNTYEFNADGTFINLSDVELLNGDTGEPFCTQSTRESGTWTIDGDSTCWTTDKAELTDFKSYTDLITRDMIESGLAEDSPPECWTISSANADTIILTDADNGASITLTASQKNED